MKKLAILILLLSLLFLIGCKERECPGFPSNLNYFPYSKGQNLKFTNSKNEVCDFEISGTKKTKKYYRSINNKGDCSNISEFSTKRNQDFMNITGFFYISGNEYDTGDVGMYIEFDNYIYKDNLWEILIDDRKFSVKEYRHYIKKKIFLFYNEFM